MRRRRNRVSWTRRISKQAQLLEVVGGQQVGLVEDQRDASVRLRLLGGEQVGGLVSPGFEWRGTPPGR